MKKTGEKKTKSKSVLASLTASTIQSRPISMDLESSDINKEKLRVSFNEMVERNEKNLANSKA